jgi:hypothetical protein
MRLASQRLQACVISVEAIGHACYCAPLLLHAVMSASNVLLCMQLTTPLKGAVGSSRQRIQSPLHMQSLHAPAWQGHAVMCNTVYNAIGAAPDVAGTSTVL